MKKWGDLEKGKYPIGLILLSVSVTQCSEKYVPSVIYFGKITDNHLVFNSYWKMLIVMGNIQCLKPLSRELYFKWKIGLDNEYWLLQCKIMTEILLFVLICKCQSEHFYMFLAKHARPELDLACHTIHYICSLCKQTTLWSLYWIYSNSTDTETTDSHLCLPCKHIFPWLTSPCKDTYEGT